MRSAALLLLIVPACASAQTTPPAAKTDHPTHTSAPHKPAAAAKPGSAKPAPSKAAPSKAAASKPAPGKPAPGKPAPSRKAPVAAPVPAPAETPAEPLKGSNTGLPLPRFAALRSDDVNFRTGPGTRYPIEWVYKRRDLPVEIEREFEIWRLVRDQQGNKGWVNQATLTGRRTAVVAGTEHVLHQSASDTAPATAKLKPGVIIRLRSCEAKSEWCQAQVGDYRGFIRRTEIWGVLPDEAIQ